MRVKGVAGGVGLTPLQARRTHRLRLSLAGPVIRLGRSFRTDTLSVDHQPAVLAYLLALLSVKGIPRRAAVIASLRRASQVVAVSAAVKRRLGAPEQSLAGQAAGEVLLVGAEGGARALGRAGLGHDALHALVAVRIVVLNLLAVDACVVAHLEGEDVLAIHLGLEGRGLQEQGSQSQSEGLHGDGLFN